MLRLIARSLRHYWRMHVALLLGTALATAVLTGALLVGDSVDYSLASFAKMRLGQIRFAAEMRGQCYRDTLADRLEARSGTDVEAVLQLPGIAIAQSPESGDAAQVNQVRVLGVDAGFWRFTDGDALELAENEIAINEKLTAELGLHSGGELALRIVKPALLARDAPLSQSEDDTTARARCIVKQVVADTALGRFSLSPSQIPPYNAFVNRAWLQKLAALEGRSNVLLIGDGAAGTQLESDMRVSWEPEDVGLEFLAHKSGVVQLQTDHIFFDPETSRAALEIPGARGVLTYLVNGISCADRRTPYSFVIAGPTPVGMRDDEIVINRWVADQLGARPGDRIDMAYYQLTASNAYVEQRRAFTVHSIVEMADLMTEKELVPSFPGLSDVESCSDWDIGMPLDEDLLKDKANEAYWKEYRQTPKAMVTLKAGQEMWSNRFGNLTAVRYPGDAARIDELRESLRKGMDPARAGLFLNPVYERAQDAVSNAMDFGGLFLGLSFFLIAAALLLTGLLHIFGLQRRAKEMGTLGALGFRQVQIRVLFAVETCIVSTCGTVLGVVAGSLYCQALIYGLGRFWQGAIAGAAIAYHGNIDTLFLGGGISLTCAMMTLALGIWRQSKRSPRALLHLDFAQETAFRGAKRTRLPLGFLPWLGLLAAAGLIGLSLIQKGGDTSLAFFAAGALLLASMLGLFKQLLRAISSRGEAPLTIARFSCENMSRRAGRSLAVAGLLACGTFLLFSVSSMREDFRSHARERASGTGGFALISESTFPLLENPATALNEADVSGVALRVRDGDDASCLNLNQVQNPRLVGVNAEDMIARGAFASPTDAAAIWHLLDEPLDDGAIPALVGDANTAMWTLKKSADPATGDRLEYQDAFGNPVLVQLVGTLPMRLSVFQGALLISSDAFTRLYPSEEGFRQFLIDAPEEKTAGIESRLRRDYERYGFDVEPASKRLEEFYAVESTYLAMFLVLGGLGLAVGSLGMGVVVLRNLLERRGEVALLRALGFGRGHVYDMLFIEYGTLLTVGLGIGAVASAVSILPALQAAGGGVSVGSLCFVLLLIVVAGGGLSAAAILTGVRMNDPGALRNE
ncbi:MAG: ABC transporter permease [Candidatus Hydrogenedentes bacterium]|nr:ABC transporter permease [Candidatus Hydrogenedentota bacterium]